MARAGVATRLVRAAAGGRAHRPRRHRSPWRALLRPPESGNEAEFWAIVRSRHPRFIDAVVADAKVTARHRGDRRDFTTRVEALLLAARLSVVSDAFLAQVCYRAKAACQARRVPLLPRLLHRLAIMTGQIAIGDPVIVRPGVYIPHGQVVIDGMVEIGAETALLPFATIGLRAGSVQGPIIGPGATVGTGAKVLGPVRIGARAQVGANAVVIADVLDDTTVVGVPARPPSASDSEAARAAGNA